MSIYSIRFRFIAILTGLTVGPLLLAIAWGELRHYRTLRSMVEITRQLEARQAASQTEDYLQSLTARFQLICGTQNLAGLGDHQRSAVLNDLMNTEKALTSLALFSADGRRLVDLPGDHAAGSLNLESGWAEGVEKGLVCSRVYYDDPQGGPYVLVAAPVIGNLDQTPAGIGLARVSLKGLNGFLLTLSPQFQGDILLLDSNRRLVGGSRRAALPALGRVLEAAPGEAANSDGQRVITGVGGFELGGQHFTVLSQVDYRQAMRRDVPLMISLGLALALSLAPAVILGLVTVKKTAQPIERLAEAALAVKSGDYSRRVEPAVNDELGQLAEAFNTMAAALEDTTGQLKEATDSKTKAEEALRQQEADFRNLMEKAPLGILVLNRQGRVIGSNPKGLEILELNNLQEAGHLYFNGSVGFFRPEQTGPLLNFNTHNMLKAVTGIMEAAYIPPGGPPKNLRYYLSLEPFRINSNGDDCDDETFQIIIEDVSEDRENHFQHSHKLEVLGTLTGGIVHDFNNILSAIIGYTELAQAERADHKALTYNLRQIMGASQRARDLVKQILSFSRRNDQEKKPLHLNALIKEIIKMIRAAMPSTIWITLNINERLPAIMADDTQISQVIMNLCTNAAYAMKEKGGVLTVNLSALKADEAMAAQLPDLLVGRVYQVLEVTDTGVGIAPETKNRIFTPFFTTKKVGDGTGMGLSVTQGIIRSHGGAITVDSREGHGATFKVYLPQTDLDVEQAPAQPDKAVQLRGRENILFVDDEPALVDIACRSLERLGYQVTGKTDSREALKLFARDTGLFQMVITDQTMPSLTGLELAQELLRLNATLPIILCTGFTQKTTLEQAKAIGIRQVLLKPTIVKELANTIRGILDRRPN